MANRQKTKQAIKKAWNAFWRIFPEFITILIATGIILSFLDTSTISRILGDASGFLGVLAAAVTGSIALIPGFVAFPMAALILEKGAGLVQIAAFVSTLMMVGVITFPMERRFFGIRIALFRNGLAFLFALLVALLMGLVLGRIGG